MSVYIQHIETLVPKNAFSQKYACERMQAWVGDSRRKRMVRKVYMNSGIDTRHTVLDDFQDASPDPMFKTDLDGNLSEPDTRERNERFALEAKRLSVDVSRRAIEGCPDLTPNSITDVIFVTCTGFSNPGPDFHIVRELGLRPSVNRYVLGFMGCYAAFPALRMAWQFCRVNPSAVVLVVSVELCSLHLQIGGGLDTILSNAIFSDGAAAAIVSSHPSSANHGIFRIDGFESFLIAEGEKEMAWRIGNHGFEITLSSYVPDIIGANIHALVGPSLARNGLTVEKVSRWAVHPGGRAILDKVQDGLGLAPEQIQASREVLRKFGNMSSATSLFVLKEMLEDSSRKPLDECVCAMAFGPGLTVEMAQLGLQRI
jgi:predicted naringenin-chalcone synthase